MRKTTLGASWFIPPLEIHNFTVKLLFTLWLLNLFQISNAIMFFTNLYWGFLYTMYFFEVFAAYRIPILETRLYIDKEQEKIRVNVDNFPYAAMLKTGDMR